MTAIQTREATSKGSAKTLTGEKMLIRLIDAGQGSSGYYPAETLEKAAENNVFPAGTHMYIDHPGEAESTDRPERTIKDLAAVLTEDAYYDAESQALVAEASVFSKWRSTLNEMKDAIGVSIRTFAEFEGNVITALLESLSVDFVTKAGRGGKILAVLESERVADEKLANDFMGLMQRAVAAKFEDAYVRDYDNEAGLVYIYAYRDEKYYEGSFEASDTSVTLGDTWNEVIPETKYTRVGGGVESKESKVADAKELTEAVEARTAAEARVVALESEIANLKTENEKLKAEKAEEAKKAAEAQGAEILNRVLGDSELPEVSQAKIREAAVIGDDFNADAFEDMLNAEIKKESEYVSAITGSTKITGFGKESDAPATGFKSAWGREYKD